VWPVVLALGAGCFPWPPPPPIRPPLPPPSTTRTLEVSRFAGIAFSEAEADRILADAGDLLHRIDAPGDVGCSIGLTRQGAVGTFTAPNAQGIINDFNDLAAVWAAPGNVHVVNQIGACGNTIAPNYAGCAQLPGTALVVARWYPNMANTEGSLWAHEHGHNKGLDHRQVPRAVMGTPLAADRRELDATECQAYLRP
jgi:hypothetical protein